MNITNRSVCILLVSILIVNTKYTFCFIENLNWDYCKKSSGNFYANMIELNDLEIDPFPMLTDQDNHFTIVKLSLLN